MFDKGRRFAALCLGAMCAASGAAGQSAVTPIPPGGPMPPALPSAPATPQRLNLTLEAGTGRVLTLAGAAANVFVADPKVAEVRPASATSLFLFGIGAGKTTVAVMDAAGGLLAEYDVTIQPSAFGAQAAQAAIARLVPNSRVQVQAQTRGMLLTGSVQNPGDAAQAVAIARSYGNGAPNIDNEMRIESPVQVTVSVRIAEMSREVVRNLGIDWRSVGSATFGAALRIGTPPGFAPPPFSNIAGLAAVPSFNGLIDALAQDNLAQVLAEPNLTVLSGQQASFQVGGEFPVPVSQDNGRISVEYKKFGVLLSFVATVFNDGRINLHVRPEVSELSSQNSVNVGTGNFSLVIPSLTVRRAETTVELGSGQSFAIAGLLQTSTLDTGSGLPGLGDIPVLGAAFRTSGLRRNEKELVIIVTPYLVKPVSDPSVLRAPTDGYATPPDIQRLLFMRQIAVNKPPVPVRLPGDAGFMVQ